MLTNLPPDFQSPTLFLLGFGLLQALLILGVIVAKGHKKRTSSMYLAGLVASITILLLCKILSKSWLWTYAQNFYLTGYFIPYLIGPFIFLYVRQTLDDRRNFQSSDALHFLPFIVFVIDHALFTITGQSVLMWMNFRYFQASTQLLSMLGYGWVSWKLVRRRQEIALNLFSDRRATELEWLRQLVVMVTTSGALATLALHTMSALHPNYTGLRWVFLILTVVIYWITYKVIWDPQLLFGHDSTAVDASKVKYTGSGLKGEEAQAILVRLTDLMDREKPFLDPVLTAERLSTMIGVSRHHISQALNTKAGRNFYDFVNEYRVLEAKRLLKDPRANHLSVAGIGSESGFNSVSSFNLVFKKHCGMTPSQFKKAGYVEGRFEMPQPVNQKQPSEENRVLS